LLYLLNDHNVRWDVVEEVYRQGYAE